MEATFLAFESQNNVSKLRKEIKILSNARNGETKDHTKIHTN